MPSPNRPGIISPYVPGGLLGQQQQPPNPLLGSILAMENPQPSDLERWKRHSMITNLPHSELFPESPVAPNMFDAIPRFTDDFGQTDPGAVQEMMAMAAKMPLAAIGSPIPAGALGMTVFHGTGLPPKGPGKPPFERFDINAVGGPGGEGAQAYGHGLYFAESPGTAKSYQTSLGSRDQFIDVGGRRIGLDSAKSPERDAALELMDAKGDFVKARRNVETSYSQPRKVIDAIDRLERQGARHVVSEPGSLLEVDIPDSAIDKMLDWDKPLSEQPESVRLAAEPYLKRMREIGWESPETKRKGADLYHFIMGTEGPHHIRQQQASAQLKQAGIPGIKYLDQVSRGKGEGTRNLVLFDDSLAKILKVNEEPVKGAGKIDAYHGSYRGGVDNFDTMRGEHTRVQGAYFTKTKDAAKKWAGRNNPKAKIISAELNIKNPATREVLDEIGYGLNGKEMREELIRRGYDGVIDDFMDEVIAFFPDQIKIKK